MKNTYCRNVQYQSSVTTWIVASIDSPIVHRNSLIEAENSLIVHWNPLINHHNSPIH